MQSLELQHVVHGSRYWRLWAAGVILVAAISSFTLATSSPAWFDEVMIVEWGRIALDHGDTDLSICLRSDSRRPYQAYQVFGTGLQELAYELTAPSNVGPHAAAFLAAIAASALFFSLMLGTGVPGPLALGLSLGLLLDPLFAQSYRGARVDSVAFLFLFAALLFGQKSLAGTSAQKANVLWPALFGVALVLGALTWPSFLMLIPLLLVELIRFGQQNGARLPVATYRSRLVSCLAGMLLAGIVIIIPFGHALQEALYDLVFSVTLQVRETEKTSLLHSVRAFADVYRMDVCILLFGIVSYFLRRDPLRLLALGAAMAIAFLTGVYSHRVLYLLPYFYLSVAWWAGPTGAAERVRAPFLPKMAVAAILATGVVMTLGVRTVSGMTDYGGKEVTTLVGAARAAIGPGDFSVVISDAELYYASRALGWRLLSGGGICEEGDPLSLPRSTEFYAQCRYALIGMPAKESSLDKLKKAGFVQSGVLLPEGGKQPRLFGHGFGAKSFGPYMILRRD